MRRLIVSWLQEIIVIFGAQELPMPHAHSHSYPLYSASWECGQGKEEAEETNAAARTNTH